jgi:hypothetical protein
MCELAPKTLLDIIDTHTHFESTPYITYILSIRIEDEHTFLLDHSIARYLYGAWTFLEHTHGSSAASRYEALSRLPVYAYIADTTMVNPILQDLKGVPSIASMEHETGLMPQWN